MTATHDTTITNSDGKPSMDVQDATIWAGDFINSCTNMHVFDLLLPAADVLYSSTGPLFENKKYSLEARLAYVLCLDALVSSPDALVEVVRRLRARLIEVSPELQALYGGSHE